ncbi:hypothetical protein MJH12_07340, partial [bacterium]|nr:hypothetical protein [bacterium]
VEIALKIKKSIKAKKLNKEIFNNLYQDTNPNNLLMAHTAPDPITLVTAISQDDKFYSYLDGALEGIQLSFKYLSKGDVDAERYLVTTFFLYRSIVEAAYFELEELYSYSKGYNEYLTVALESVKNDLYWNNFDYDTSNRDIAKQNLDFMIQAYKKASINIQQIREALPLKAWNSNEKKTLNYWKLTGALEIIKQTFPQLNKKRDHWFDFGFPTLQKWAHVDNAYRSVISGTGDILDKHISNIKQDTDNSFLILAIKALRSDLQLEETVTESNLYFMQLVKQRVRTLENSIKKINSIIEALPIK